MSPAGSSPPAFSLSAPEATRFTQSPSEVILDPNCPAFAPDPPTDTRDPFTSANIPVASVTVRMHPPEVQANVPLSSPSRMLAAVESPATPTTNFPHGPPAEHPPCAAVSVNVTGSPPTFPSVVATPPALGIWTAENW
ncbi:MAG TPA: hypothetical protein VJT32_02355 [bacterium]|nr:hypothetical protein [bacterium]